MTNMNACSSRSHAIFTINVRHHTKGEELVRSSTLHLVDLAGSVMPCPARRELAEGRRDRQGACQCVAQALPQPQCLMTDRPLNALSLAPAAVGLHVSTHP